MEPFKKQSNEEKLAYLMLVLDASKRNDKKSLAVYYSIFLIRFGTKVPVIIREPASTNLKDQVNVYAGGTFNPDFIVIDLFTGKSRSVTKPFATFKFDYKNKR